MISPIQPIQPPLIPEPPAAVEGGQGGASFQSFIESAIRSVGEKQAEATHSTEQFLKGEDKDVHSVLLDVQRADLAFEFFLQVRNKVVQAYQEIMRMPL